MKCLIGAIIAGLVLFAWGAVSWMVLPWHNKTLHDFANEKTVLEMITTNAPQTGIFILPSPSNMQQQSANQPFVFVAMNREGMASMTMPLIVSLITQIVAALFVAWMLSMTTGLSYAGRVFFVVLFALAAALITHIPYWNWFGFEARFTLLQMGDLVIGWFLAGLVLAGFSCPPRARMTY